MLKSVIMDKDNPERNYELRMGLTKLLDPKFKDPRNKLMDETAKLFASGDQVIKIKRVDGPVDIQNANRLLKNG